MKADKIFVAVSIFLFAAWLDPYADYVRQGNSDFSKGDFKSAIENYEKAEKYLPSKSKEADLAFNKAAAYSAKGSFDIAEEYYREALKSDNKEIQKKSFYNLGNMYSRSGDIAKAADAYMNALKIDPEYKNARNNLENILKEQKKDDKDEKKKDDDKKNDGSSGKDNKDSDKKDNADQKNNGKDQQQDMQQKGQLSREQIEKILKDYQNMPVKRMKGKNQNGGQVLEKDW